MAAKIIDNTLVFHKGFKKVTLSPEDIKWSYLQAEDGSGKMCCGQFNYTIYRVIVITKDDERCEFMYEDEKAAKSLLAQIGELSTDIAIGYTAENKARFGIK